MKYAILVANQPLFANVDQSSCDRHYGKDIITPDLLSNPFYYAITVLPDSGNFRNLQLLNSALLTLSPKKMLQQK